MLISVIHDQISYLPELQEAMRAKIIAVAGTALTPDPDEADKISGILAIPMLTTIKIAPMNCQKVTCLFKTN